MGAGNTHRQSRRHLLDVRRTQRGIERAHDRDGVGERPLIAHEKHLQLNADVAEALRFGGWTPAAEGAESLIREEALHDDDEVRRERRAPFPRAKDRVVVFDQRQLDRRREVVDVRSDDVRVAADEAREALHQREVGAK